MNGSSMKPNIILIAAWKSSHAIPPLGIAYLAAVLRENEIPCLLLDYAFISDEEFAKKLKEIKPKIVGISFMSNNYVDAKRLAEIARKTVNPVLVAGGPHPTVMPKKTLEETCFDIVVMGEGELTFLELVKAIETGANLSKIKGICYKTKNNRIMTTEQREFIADLDTIPWPARDLLEMDQYLKKSEEAPVLHPHTHVIAVRGCPFNCFFCQPTSRNMFGAKVRIRSVKNVLEEARFLIDNYKLNSVSITGDTLTFDKKWIMEFCDQIQKQNLKMKWVAGTRVNTVDLEMLREMKKAGCYYVGFGVESGSQRILNEIMHKGITVEQTKQAFKWCKEVKMLARANIMIGTPTETKKDIQMTIDLLNEIRADYTTTFPTNPLAGTHLYDYALEKNLLLRDVKTIDRKTEDTLKREITPKEMRMYIKYFWYITRKQNFADMILLRKGYRIKNEFVRRLQTLNDTSRLLNESISNLLLPAVLLYNYLYFKKRGM